MQNHDSNPSSSAALLDRAAASGDAAAIRVASIPADHVYVRHLSPEHRLPGVPQVERLRDPDPDAPSRPAQSRWWPPVMLDPAWVREHPEFDIAHLQFGFDARAPEDLQEWVDALHETGRPLVYTVHDLRNPHHIDRRLHDEQLDVLIPQADALVTLTPGAAAEIRARWNREAHVLAHPHVVDLETMRRVSAQPRAEGPLRIGIHLKSLRASMNPLPVVRALSETVSELPGVELQVNGHRDVLTESGARHDPELSGFLRDEAASGRLELHIHDFMDDASLWRYLASLDASVLPYRFGTHSGWLEACRDLGTAVIAPSCGYYREQGPVFEYLHAEDDFDAGSLDRAVRRALAAGPTMAEPTESRRIQRESIAVAHAVLYERLLR